MATLRVPQTFLTIVEAFARARTGDTVLIDASYSGIKVATVTTSGLTVSAPNGVAGLILDLGQTVSAITLAGTAEIQVRGNSAANVIVGNDGNDWLVGRAGNDTLNGSFGIDTADYRDAIGGVTVNLLTGQSFGADGADTLISIEAVRGSQFADSLTGNAEMNYLRGMRGNDRLDGGDGFDYADYRDATGAVTVNLATGRSAGADGADTLVSIEYAIGSSFNDILIGDDGESFLRGMRGNDRLDGGGGSDFADYINATGSVTVNLATGRSSGADGSDAFISIENARGSNFNDTLIGSLGDNALRGLKGNDRLDGGAGFDTADYINATGAVNVNLATGTTSGADGVDTLVNIEYIRGSMFNDTLTGDGAGNWLTGMGGDDRLDGGGSFNDWADFRRAAGSVTVNLATGRSSGADGADTLINIEHARGSNFDDTLIGNAGTNHLRGLGGNDRLDGGAGMFDRANYHNATGAVTVNLATGRSSGAEGNDTLVNIEGVVGSAFADTINGDSGNNYVNGQQGNDRIDGGGGYDYAEYFNAGGSVTANLATGQVSGADGFDTLVNMEGLSGSHYNDALTGNSGNNVLQGNGGFDRLTGGQGQDLFWFNRREEGGDTIVDFSSADDTIKLNHAGFGQLVGTGTLAQAGVSFVLGSAATGNNETLIYNRSTGQLFWDGNGAAAGGSTLLATFSNKAALSENDFSFV